LIFQGHIKVTKSLTLKLKDLQKKERLKAINFLTVNDFY